MDGRSRQCRHPPCTKPAKRDGSFSGRFCSTACELKFEHIKADAKDARLADEEPDVEEPHG